VKKALELEEKLQDMPHLQKAIETQGINKVGIVIGLATRENEKELAEKVEHMSKPALQEYSKEVRGKVTASWQVELDEKMMFMFLKLKKKLGKNLSNKECLRKILEKMQEKSRLQKRITQTVDCRATKISKEMQEKPKPQGQDRKSAKILGRKSKPQGQAQKLAKIPGENSRQKKLAKIPGENSRQKISTKISVEKVTRYISVHEKKEVSEHCGHPGCHRPAEIIHHTNRFSQCHNHKNLKPLCRVHHEFAHNGISEPMRPADHKYRKHRKAALLQKEHLGDGADSLVQKGRLGDGADSLLQKGI
jgi:hypothetical protein